MSRHEWPPGKERPGGYQAARPDQKLVDTTTNHRQDNAPPRQCDVGTLGAAAVDYAEHHWPVFPLRGKTPAIPNPHPKGSRERQQCKGECGKQGHGVLDATTDVARIRKWWSRHPRHNIGGQVPASMFVLDIDPYHGGMDTLAVLVAQHAPLPETLTDYSGRGDGGTHLFFRRPPGRLSSTRLGSGIDLKTSTGYVVLPPSVHPDTGKPYTRIEAPVAAPPAWLVDLITQRPAPAAPPRKFRTYTGVSIANQFSASTSWADILGPHGWTCHDADPDGDGAVWLHPTHTSNCSATVKNGCLFVWSTSTVFDITEAGIPHGYPKFRAYALLNHNGDMKAAAQALRGVN